MVFRKWVLIALGFAAALSAQTQVSARRHFELVSIKPNSSGRPTVQGNPLTYSPGGRFTAINVTMVDVLVRVYPTRRIQMEGGPDWIDSDRWDIIAKADEAEGEITPEQRPLIVQTLLEGKFKLQFHKETREMTVSALVVGKPIALVESKATQSMLTNGRGGQMIFQRASMVTLVNTLSNILGTPVVNETGINGSYDFTLDPGRFLTPEARDNFDRGNAVIMAVQEQLGLKLEKRKAPLEFTIIDRAERPTPD